MALLIATILVSVAITVYLTALLSRWHISRGRKPPFWATPITALCGVVIVLFGSEGLALFTDRFWNDLKTNLLPYFVFCMCVGALINVGPAVATVIFYRKKRATNAVDGSSSKTAGADVSSR